MALTTESFNGTVHGEASVSPTPQGVTKDHLAGVLDLDSDGTIKAANSILLQNLGYSLEQVQGRHFHSLMDPSHAAVAADLWPALVRGQVVTSTLRFFKASGQPIWLQFVCRPNLDERDQFAGAVAYCTDLTLQKQATDDTKSQLEAVDRTMAVIEFDLDGTVRQANANFLQLLGYSLEEIKGRHHRIFVPPHYAASHDYETFWFKLNKGQFVADEFKRIGKNGKEIWIQASYSPILDGQGRPYKVVKYATDITEQKMASSDSRGQLEAVGRTMAVIEFELDGTVRTANANFLRLLGYSLDEIKGRHHRLFVDPAHAMGPEYEAFWHKLQRGEFVAGEFKRLGKHGSEVWIQASYSPILDAEGKPFKVVKYATDVTAQKLSNSDFAGQLQAINKTMAVIEFDLDGVIKTANGNFLQAMGYTLSEIAGQHHRMFVEPKDANSPAYAEFWAKLRRGDFVSGEFLRLGQGGREVFIQASYNPILGLDGKPYKVVKYATDVSKQVQTRHAVGDVATQLSAASHQLTGVAESLAGSSEESVNQATAAAAAGEQVSASIYSVAGATEEMVSSIREIAQNAGQAAQVASRAVQVTLSTNQLISKLGDSSLEIGEVSEVITSIAQQTNLLALNATIEAARAGEVGRGFAVVANEVKDLAKETARASKDISKKIAAIQHDATGAVSAIEEVTTIIHQISEIANSIAGAVEEQSATTSEISRSVGEAAQGSKDISASMATLATSAREGTAGANETLDAARALGQYAQQLQTLMRGFC